MPTHERTNKQSINQSNKQNNKGEREGERVHLRITTNKRKKQQTTRALNKLSSFKNNLTVIIKHNDYFAFSGNLRQKSGLEQNLKPNILKSAIMKNNGWQAFKNELSKQINVLTENAKSSETQKRDILQFCVKTIEANDKVLKKIEDCKAFNRIIRNCSGKNSKRDCAIIRLAQYLWIYEILYIPCVNYLCYLLIMNGHDLRDYHDNYANTLKDIEIMNCSLKMEFLIRHNFKIIARDVDRNMRNGIAHQDYAIDDNGVIKIRNNEINIMERIDQLIDFCVLFWENYTLIQTEINKNLAQELGVELKQLSDGKT